MSLTFPVLTAFKLNWTLTDSDGNGVNNATVTATLYAGRSRTNPTAVPGTSVPPIVALVLTYVADSVGVYSADVPATLNPTQSSGFIIVVDGVVALTNVYHAEETVVIETDGSPLDLTTVDLVKEWIGGMDGIDTADDLIQLCITAWSTEFMRLTGTGDQNGNYTQSPFTAICNWTEVYDGNGHGRLFLRNRPVRSVTSLVINNGGIPASSSSLSSGYAIDASGKSLVLRGGGPGQLRQYSNWQSGPYRALGAGLKFWEGTQNVNVSYVAGYDVTPADIVDAANNMVQLNYKRKAHIDEKSRAVSGGGGTVVWADWDIPPGVQTVIDNYQRIG